LEDLVVDRLKLKLMLVVILNSYGVGYGQVTGCCEGENIEHAGYIKCGEFCC